MTTTPKYNPHPTITHRDATDNQALVDLAQRRQAKHRDDVRALSRTDLTESERRILAEHNGHIAAWEEVRQLADKGTLPYTEPTALPTEFERVRMLTESGEKPQALLTSNMGIGDLHLAKDQYSEEHVRAAREIQAVRKTMNALASVLNVDGLKTSTERANLVGKELADALPFSEKTEEHWTEEIVDAIYKELDHQKDLGYDVQHDDKHHSPETMLQHAAKYRGNGKYVKFAAYAVAAARLELYRNEATKAGVALPTSNGGVQA